MLAYIFAVMSQLFLCPISGSGGTSAGSLRDETNAALLDENGKSILQDP